MVHPLSYDYNATAQIAAASLLPNLRLFQVGRQWSNNPGAVLPLGCHDNGTTPGLNPHCSSGLRNIWRSPTPEGDPGASSFSAVCYLTAQELMRTELGENVSVGLVEADWGGSSMAAWQTRDLAVARGCAAEPPVEDSCPLAMTHISPIRGNNWACLLHGMIQPLTRSLRPFLALWYQGESNSNDPPDTYQCQLEAMIAEWRAAFNSSSMPFFLVQLAPYWQGRRTGANFPAIRIAQAQAVETAMAETGVASGYCVTHDLGDHAGGIHPHNKTEVARRLAIEIRAKVFGTQGLPRIPSVSSVCANQNASNRLEIRFQSTVTELRWSGTHNCTECCTANTSVVEICDANECTNQTSMAWTAVPARWENDNGSRFLAVDAIASTKAVRYAWSNYPECVLFDSAGLPVPPFNQSIGVCR